MKRVIKASSDSNSLGLFSTYYRYATDGDRKEFGITREDENYDKESLSDYEIEYVGPVVLKLEIGRQAYNALAGRGYDLLIAGRREDTGELGLFTTSYFGNQNPRPISIEKIESIIDKGQ